MQTDPIDYRLGLSKTGYWEIRWSERSGSRTISRTASTRTRSRVEAEIVLGEWVKARSAIQIAQTTPNIENLVKLYSASARTRGVGAGQFQSLKPIVGYFGQHLPTQIDDELVRDYCATRGVADATLRRELGALTAVLNFAGRKKRIPTEIIPDIDLPPPGDRREVYLSEQEDEDFTKLLLQDPLSRVSRFGLLAIRTGARKGAIEGLTWDRVDLNAQFVDYRDPGMKQSKKRRVPVPIDNVLLPVLRLAYQNREDDYVIGKGSIRKAFDTFRGRHPRFQHVTPHVLRHTAATRWLRNGMDIWHVAGLLGDTVETTTKVYGHHATQDLRAAMSGTAGSSPDLSVIAG